MKLMARTLLLALLMGLIVSSTLAQDAEKIESYQLWLGTHINGFDDYSKKVGEYRYFDENLLPSAYFRYRSLGPESFFELKANYQDKENGFGSFSVRNSDRLTAKVRFRSQTRQLGQDLLENLEAREWLGSNPGGKILTHEILDPDADYNYARREVLSELNVLMSRKHNIRFIAAHRTIVKEGREQSISNNHCFSCHIESNGLDIQQQTNQIELGVKGEAGSVEAGYTFGYRLYESELADGSGLYDEARHPVNGGSGAEFSSRVSFDDTIAVINAEPKTEKLSHKLKLTGDLGKGRWAGSVTYNRAENQNTNLVAKTWVGAVRYAVPISTRTRLIAKASGMDISADDPFIDLPNWRDGRSGDPISFDFIRYSSLDRMEWRGSAELIHKLNRKATVSFLAGYKKTDRDDYPIVGDGISTGKFTGQAKLRYRHSLKASGSLKYKYEKTSDPFTSGRGLFEADGSQQLVQLDDSVNFIFYFQREALRYQNITTVPTDYHEIDARSTLRPSNKTSINLGLRLVTDKNGDLDSLDVEHFRLTPNVSFSVIPSQNWTFTSGYTLNHFKSRGPVTVALFDG